MDDDTRELIEMITEGDVGDRVAALIVLQDDPSGEARVHEVIETVLDDRRGCMITAPATFAEVRWVAAHALAAERHAAGVKPAVRLPSAVRPLRDHELDALGEAHRATTDPAESRVRLFDELNGAGLLPKVALNL